MPRIVDQDRLDVVLPEPPFQSMAPVNSAVGLLLLTDTTMLNNMHDRISDRLQKAEQ